MEGTDGDMPVADQPVGYLATTVTLYDALEKDIRRAFPSIHRAVGKVSSCAYPIRLYTTTWPRPSPCCKSSITCP